ncbi:hypothetical protein [Gracilimonas sp.]|uniref:hypothetical protein n=1 Tax=Gracilimonas sp. TaxID=1974203 RepID=UPI0037534499
MKSILILLLFSLSFGQGLMGFSGSITNLPEAEIQPVHKNDSESFPRSSAYLLNVSAPTETIIHHSNRLSPQFSESHSNEEEFRYRAEEEKAKQKRRACLVNAEIIKRSLTFRELIYPHHCHF